MSTHKELITAGKFDEKFKRALLDYYSYGFKSLSFYDEKKRQTLSEDWLRLNRVIADYLEWSENRGGVMFANTDSQSMEDNPFHRIYAFCKYTPLTSPAYFFHTIAALSPIFRLRYGAASLVSDDEQRMRLEDALSDKLLPSLKTSELIWFYTEKIAPNEGSDRNKTPNNRLNDLYTLGVVECERHDGQKGGKGDRRWRLPELTMRRLLDAGRKVGGDFERHFHSALDFFSKYYLLGEVGGFLVDRTCADSVSPFRFKHEYFMQSLNDFNIADLLYAVENGKWCGISYTHGIGGVETRLICYPLEIRVSNMQGRQFLMYYEPFRRCYSALRIEFIDSVEFYEDKKVRAMLAQTGHETSAENVERGIAAAKNAMRYSWGVSAAEPTVLPHTVSVKIAYDPKKENFIAQRLRRECRSGSVYIPEDEPYIYFKITVADEAELRPWLRTFYSRIVSCEGMDSEQFTLDNDVKSFAELFNNDKLASPPQTAKDKKKPQKWGIPAAAAAADLGGSKARAHDQLFNEIFSVYYYIMGEVLVRLSSGGEGVTYSEREIDRIILQAFNKFYLKIGQKTEELLPAEIKELLFDGGFMIKTQRTAGEPERVKNKYGGFDIIPAAETAYAPKYICAPDTEFYRDALPLSALELRWLKTILKDERINTFLSEQEIAALDKVMTEYAPGVKALPMDKVVYYDRFHFPEKDKKREALILDTLLKAIELQKTVFIKYHSMRNKILYGEYKPIVIEFSKRNNRFQCILQECESGWISNMNVFGIKSVHITDMPFDHTAAESELADLRERSMTSVQIEFYNVLNIADRILTEFSPWKKLCTLDRQTGLYRLTVFYHKEDETDLVIRLMSYGAYLRFTDKQHPICMEIQRRIGRQLERDAAHKRKQRELSFNR